MTDPVDPASSRGEIVAVAVDLIARDGVAATSAREVARVAGVSAPLIIHHFGSKAGLVAACDEYVRGVIEQTTSALSAGGRDAGIQAVLATPDIQRAIDYVSRSLSDGGDVGQWWFDQLLDMFAGAHRQMTSIGVARTLDDEDMAIVLMSAMELGMLIMRPMIEARLGHSLTEPETLERWALAEADLLTHGYLIDEPAADSRDDHG